MRDFMRERIAYGRHIRERAEHMLEAHGPQAEAEALSAAQEPGAAAAERSFWESVAARIARQRAPARLPGRFDPDAPAGADSARRAAGADLSQVRLSALF